MHAFCKALFMQNSSSQKSLNKYCLYWKSNHYSMNNVPLPPTTLFTLFASIIIIIILSLIIRRIHWSINFIMQGMPPLKSVYWAYVVLNSTFINTDHVLIKTFWMNYHHYYNHFLYKYVFVISPAFCIFTILSYSLLSWQSNLE